MFQVERIKNETIGAGKPGLKLECYHVNGLAVERRGFSFILPLVSLLLQVGVVVQCWYWLWLWLLQREQF